MTLYELDTDRTTLEFSVRHLIISTIRGRFTNFVGSIDLDHDDITRSKVTVEIDASSITTDEAERDANLRSQHFLDVEQFPVIRFESERIEVDGAHLRVIGPLTMHGVTRDVTLRAEPLGSLTDPYDTGRIAFAVAGAIDRVDFGLRGNQSFAAGGVVAGLLGDRVAIALDVRAVRLVARAAA
jgi:polyisoprenoid-binding protein YceI